MKAENTKKGMFISKTNVISEDLKSFTNKTEA